MNIPAMLLSTAVSLLCLAVVFGPLEKAFPAKKQKFFRPEWWTDLFFFLGQYLLWSGLVFLALYALRDWLDAVMPTGFRRAVAAQSWWLQAVEMVILSDLLVYWGHRLQHKVGFLWRFHSIHHSAEHMDWLAAHREHPVDTIYTMGLINLPAFVLGFPLETLAGFIAFRGMWAIYIHSNVRLPLGPLRYLVGAPEMHHWHHDRARDAGNYANISPMMDVIFGTHYCPDHEPEAFGIQEPIARSYLGQMLHPFRRRKPKTDSTGDLFLPPSVILLRVAAIVVAVGTLTTCVWFSKSKEPSVSRGGIQTRSSTTDANSKSAVTPVAATRLAPVMLGSKSGFARFSPGDKSDSIDGLIQGPQPSELQMVIQNNSQSAAGTVQSPAANAAPPAAQRSGTMMWGSKAPAGPPQFSREPAPRVE